RGGSVAAGTGGLRADAVGALRPRPELPARRRDEDGGGRGRAAGRSDTRRRRARERARSAEQTAHRRRERLRGHAHSGTGARLKALVPEGRPSSTRTALGRIDTQLRRAHAADRKGPHTPRPDPRAHAGTRRTPGRALRGRSRGGGACGSAPAPGALRLGAGTAFSHSEAPRFLPRNVTSC
ncbi:PREDICTED: serine/arginine repetitive matrix protein 3-like, partial [Chinchilla lanigera]|uniref:serine/arginine repetitive matrix protein 3-like n=1 Tax=Chinchilla lanigera TaxID=34839 RepID=UPI00069732E1